MKKSLHSYFFPIISTIVEPGYGQNQETATKKLECLFGDFWEFNMREYPLWATFCGDNRYNNLLGEVTVADYERRLVVNQSFLERLGNISCETLTVEEKGHYDFFRYQLNDAVKETELKFYFLPVTGRMGFYISFPQLPNQVPLNTVDDYKNYIARLSQFKTYVEQHVVLMQTGLKQGYNLPAVALAGFEDAITPHIVEDPTKSLLYAPFTRFPMHFSEEENQQLKQAGEQAILESVVVGYQDFLTFMKTEYVLAAREEIGASALPNGRAYYEHCVRSLTSLDLKPEEIHQTGLEEIKRIRKEMEALIKKVEFKGDFAEFIKFLQTDPRFYATTAKELMKEVSYILKKMDGQLPRLFKTLPRTPCGLEEVPAYMAPKTAIAYYTHPAGDGSRAGFYYVNTYDLKSRPFYELEALTLHEALPGHHLQIALQYELKNLPPFRRFSISQAFAEGWALYAERLGLEAGFYQDPYSDFGRLTYEMSRACRLVVDTGMHALEWSRQQAIDFMALNTNLTLRNIENDIDRFIAWPAQALTYKIGELKIRKLRMQAEEALGNKFCIREFHEVVLKNGAVPLSILENNVKTYIAAELEK